MTQKGNKVRKRKKTDLPPGSIVYTGDKKVRKVTIHHLKYDENIFEQSETSSYGKVVLMPSEDEIIDWYDMCGLHDVPLIESLGYTFNVHPLILEDIADIYQRPKFEEYENGIFVVIRALSLDDLSVDIKTEQVAIYFKKGLLLSFQENESDLFHSVRTRIQAGKGRIRQRGADYLCYAIMDSLVDKYFLVLDQIEERLESFEERISNNPDNNTREGLHHLKKQLISIRKSVAPLREAIGMFSKTESGLIDERTSFFLRDLYDHTIQIMDIVDTYRDTLNGLQDLYLSEISFKMNQVMQILTIITTIFVPLSFLAGVYGMNFEYMPELKFRYGYFVLLGTMVLVFIGLLIFFRHRKWF